jgi:hypothetical protein
VALAAQELIEFGPGRRGEVRDPHRAAGLLSWARPSSTEHDDPAVAAGHSITERFGTLRSLRRRDCPRNMLVVASLAPIVTMLTSPR